MKNLTKALAIVFAAAVLLPTAMAWLVPTSLLCVLASPIIIFWKLWYFLEKRGADSLQGDDKPARLYVLERRKRIVEGFSLGISIVFMLAFYWFVHNVSK